MTDTDERTGADRLQILLNEKQLMHGEKLGLILSIKQTYAVLAVVIGLLLNTAYADNVRAAYLVIPYVVSGAVCYIMTNSVMLLLISRHLEILDQQLQSVVPRPILWQSGMGSEVIRWGILIPAKARIRPPNPYFLLGIATGILGFGIVISSLSKSWSYLNDVSSLSAALGYTIVTGLVLFACASCGAYLTLDRTFASRLIK